MLALVSTLIVYPQLTTRVREDERVDAPDEALSYLRNLYEIVGAKNANFNVAFAFTRQNTTERRRDRRTSTMHSSREDSEVEHDEQRGIVTKIANETSLYSRAHDFWAIVGWALNCAHVHAQRWKRWHLWLELMTETMFDDLAVRLRNCDAQSLQTAIQETLLTQYLDCESQGRAQKRRVMRAVFADASSKALAEFPEIWRNETKPPKPLEPDNARARKKLDFDEDEFADYLGLDIDEDGVGQDLNEEAAAITTQVRRSRSRRQADAFHEPTSIDEATGSIDPKSVSAGMPLRQRLISLLMTHSLATDMFFGTAECLGLLTEHIINLRLVDFAAYVLPTTDYLCPDANTSLVGTILKDLISNDAPVEPGHINLDGLINIYLPYAAVKPDAASNAKLSLCLESLLLMMGKSRREMGLKLESTPITKVNLLAAIADGCQARDDKTSRGAGRGSKKTDAKSEDDEAFKLLTASGQRMSFYVERCM